MQLGEKLKRLRNQAHLTQEKVAKEIGVTRSAYAYYEVGQSKPKLSTLQKIANLYNNTTDELLSDNSVSQGDIADFAKTWSTDNRFNELTEYEQSVVLKPRMLTKDKKIELMDFLNNL